MSKTSVFENIYNNSKINRIIQESIIKNDNIISFQKLNSIIKDNKINIDLLQWLDNNKNIFIL